MPHPRDEPSSLLKLFGKGSDQRAAGRILARARHFPARRRLAGKGRRWGVVPVATEHQGEKGVGAALVAWDRGWSC